MSHPRPTPQYLTLCGIEPARLSADDRLLMIEWLLLKHYGVFQPPSHPQAVREAELFGYLLSQRSQNGASAAPGSAASIDALAANAALEIEDAFAAGYDGAKFADGHVSGVQMRRNRVTGIVKRVVETVTGGERKAKT